MEYKLIAQEVKLKWRRNQPFISTLLAVNRMFGSDNAFSKRETLAAFWATPHARIGATGVLKAFSCDLPQFLLSNRIANAYNHWCRSEEHTSELQSLMRISYAVF